jgi:fermentation-respiration switch protein FrsA (DUF1100 family)
VTSADPTTADPPIGTPICLRLCVRQFAIKWSWKLGRIVVFAYIGLAIVLAVFQAKLIFPGAATQGTKDAVVTPTHGAELVNLTAKSGERITALFGGALTRTGGPRTDAGERPTLVYFYGNGMCMADTVVQFDAFRYRGFNIIVPDFIGYGMSTGKPSEQGVYATADAAYDYLLTRNDIDPKKIVPMGWSLGAAGAVHLASTRTVPALVTISAFTSMADMAHANFPYIPAKLFLQHHFENEQKIRTVHVPYFNAHGTHDRIIPWRMSQALIESAGGKTTKYDVVDGDHNDVFDVGGTPLMDAITSFLEANTAEK